MVGPADSVDLYLYMYACNEILDGRNNIKNYYRAKHGRESSITGTVLKFVV